jgi:hypothetical protein
MQPEFCRVTSDPYFDDLIEPLRDNIFIFLQIMIFFSSPSWKYHYGFTGIDYFPSIGYCFIVWWWWL